MKYRVTKRNYFSFARNVGDIVEIANYLLRKRALLDNAIVLIEDKKEEVVSKPDAKGVSKKPAKRFFRK